MIKEKLMDALKRAAADYNGGMSANDAVVKAAEASDFNEKQAERLVEMFNTLATLNKEKDASDPTGSCELASKDEVIRSLLGNCTKNEASKEASDYGFYRTEPTRTNGSIEARKSGFDAMAKAASSAADDEPEELKVSQRSLFKIISGQIDMLKSAASAADDVARNARLEIERLSIKVAKAIESPFADNDLADMFKAACPHKKTVDNIAEYSTKVAESSGGRFAKMHVFDASPIDELLKSAEEAEGYFSVADEHERKRDFYLSKAAEAEKEMELAVGIVREAKKETIADMFVGVQKRASQKESDDDPEAVQDADVCLKVASLIKESGASSDVIEKLASRLEKDASINMGFAIPFSSAGEVHGALSKHVGIDSEQKRTNNIRRSIILADLMSNDPIIRDADPEIVTEAYKTMIMSAPRVSLDKSQARAFLRSAVNSVAISPSDAKVLGEVDKYTALANASRLDDLTRIDSSIKDSNV